MLISEFGPRSSLGPVGKQNKHCLCATCEDAGRGGYAPPGTYPETSDSEREKEFLKQQAAELEKSSPNRAEGANDGSVPAVSALTGTIKTEESTPLPPRRTVPLVTVPSGIEDLNEGDPDAASYAETDAEVMDVSDSEAETRPSISLDTDNELDDGRETDAGPQGAEETDVPRDVSDDSDMDSPPPVKISLNPSSPPSSPHFPLASGVASRLGLVKPNGAGTASNSRVKQRLRDSEPLSAVSAPSTSRPTLSMSSLPSQKESSLAPGSSAPAKRTRASALSTPTESAASTPSPSGPPELAPRRASSRLNSTKDKQGSIGQVPTPPLSDEGVIGVTKDKVLQRSLRSRAGAASTSNATAQPSARVTRRAFLKPAAPRPAGTGTSTPTGAPARPEKKVARKGKDCQVCLATLPKPNRDEPPKLRIKCFRCVELQAR